MIKRVIVIGIVLALLVGVGGIWFTRTQTSLAADGSTRQAVTIEQGTVISAVKATGRLESRLEVALGFETGGTVAEVLVERGQSVQAGDPLAWLETDDLLLQLAQAEANLSQVRVGARPEDIVVAEASLRSAQANYDKVAAGSRPEDIATAEASLRSAWASYKALLDGPDEEEITVAAANLRSAEVTLQSAQWAYDEIAYADDVGATPQAAELQRATISYESALASYKLAVQAATDEQLTASRSQVEQAQAQLDKLKNSPTPEELAIAQAQVEQAQAQLDKLKNSPTPEELAIAQVQVDQARLKLEQATLTAPIAGIVTEVNLAVGERPGTAAVILLANLSALHIDLPVDEIDLPAVKVSQPATITLDALPGNPLPGRVTAIAPAPVSAASGVTSYEVTVTLAGESEQAKVGMTANVGIETNRRENVVVIPAHLVQVNQATGQTYVEKLATAGQAAQTDVTLGLRSGQTIEVLSGLEAGDRVLVPLPPGQAPTASSGGGLFSGMRKVRESAPK